MEVQLESKLASLAARQGRRSDELVEDALVRYLDDESRFLEAVQVGIDAADRGEFIDDPEMEARFKAILAS